MTVAKALVKCSITLCYIHVKTLELDYLLTANRATLPTVLQRTLRPEVLAQTLIVEDDAVILDTLAYNLARQGFGVEKATSGAEALKLARKMRPDLILLDLMLPGASGIQVCEKLREEDSEVVIIMVTAKDAEEDKVQGFAAGADD
jgi:CheY-like chemotaxis protein